MRCGVRMMSNALREDTQLQITEYFIILLYIITRNRKTYIQLSKITCFGIEAILT